MAQSVIRNFFPFTHCYTKLFYVTVISFQGSAHIEKSRNVLLEINLTLSEQIVLLAALVCNCVQCKRSQRWFDHALPRGEYICKALYKYIFIRFCQYLKFLKIYTVKPCLPQRLRSRCIPSTHQVKI